ncbi:MAG TPA: alginate export family protein [Verrucomicrobiae bacterium]|nr:alginate export family protein [Verrucomicrobiae bacterium]
MKSKITKLSVGTLLCAAINSVHAQYAPPPPPAPFAGFLNEYLRTNDPYMNQWDFGGNIRLRYEVKDGYAIPGVPGSLDFRDHGADDVNEYFLTRIRYHIGYTDKWWSAYAEGRSSFADGDERSAYANNPAVPGMARYDGNGPESDTVDLHQAFVTVGNHKEFPLSLKVGRQELSYGDERLIGAFGWNNIGRVFDGAKLRWQNEWFGADFFATRPVIPEDERFNVSNDYDWFSGVYATTPLVPKNSLDVYFLARNSTSQASAAEPRPQFPQPSARDIYTAGFRLKSKPGEFGNWDYLVETAGQFGDFRDLRLGVNSPRLEHQAYMGVIQGGYTFSDLWGTPRLALEYSYASGDSNPADDKHETFENLFPTNHKFYGYMDMVSLQNIHDVRGIFQLKPHKQVSLALEGHGFWLADTHDNFYNVAGVPRGGVTTTPGNGYGINPGYSNFVGTELDAIAGYAVTRFAQLEAGYGHFFAGNYIQQSLSAPAFGARDADFVYLQATLSF